MKQTFERIEKHLYRREYETSTGEIKALYYAVFVDWKGIRRKFPLRDCLDDARDELGRLHTLNKGRFDWDAEKRERERLRSKSLTVSAYAPTFLKTKAGMPSYDFWKVCCSHLERLLGDVALEEITRSKIAEYKRLRLGEPIQRHGKAVEGMLVRPSTVNREITTLVGVLNLAAEEGLLEKIPATKKLKDPEDHLARERVLEAGEYKKLLEASPRWLQRAIIGAYEACLSRIDLLTLTSADVYRKRPEAAMIKLTGGRHKTKARQKVPISPALGAVLDESEKVTSLHAPSLVFTRDGKPLKENGFEKAFKRAAKAAGLTDVHFHDLRHCAVTRWTLAGIPEELRKIAAGHSRGSVHQRYINPPDEQMFAIFAEKLGWKNVHEMFPQQLRENAECAN